MKLFKKHELSQNCLEGSTFLYKKKTRLTSPRVKLYLFHKTKRATGVFGHGLCNKTECKVDTRNKFLNLHWFVILDMRIPAHVRILRKLGPDFKTEAVDVPILLCTTHFSRKTQNIFLSTGVFPENFELTNSGKKTEPSLRKELTSFLQIKSLHKPSIYIRIAQHMRTAHSEFVKKGNSVQSAEIPFAINPFEKLPTGRVKKPEETEFEDTDSDEPTISQTGQPEKEPCLADHISADVANQSPTREVVHEHEPACVPSAVVSELANPSTCSVDTTSDRICQCSEKNVCISCRRKRQFVSYEQCSKFQNSQQIFDVHFVEPYQPNSSHQEIISLSQKYNNLAQHFNTLMNKVAIQDLVKNGVSVRCKCSTEEMKLKIQNLEALLAAQEEVKGNKKSVGQILFHAKENQKVKRNNQKPKETEKHLNNSQNKNEERKQ